KKILAPHHAFINPQVVAFVIAAMLENSFPTLRFSGQKLGSQQRRCDPVGSSPVEMVGRWEINQLSELQQSAGGNRGRGALPWAYRIRLFPVVWRVAILRCPVDEELGAFLGGI